MSARFATWPMVSSGCFTPALDLKPGFKINSSSAPERKAARCVRHRRSPAPSAQTTCPSARPTSGPPAPGCDCDRRPGRHERERTALPLAPDEASAGPESVQTTGARPTQSSRGRRPRCLLADGSGSAIHVRELSFADVSEQLRSGFASPLIPPRSRGMNATRKRPGSGFGRRAGYDDLGAPRTAAPG